MQLENLKKRFYTIVAPSLPNEWEVEDILTGLLELQAEEVESLMGQVAVIWPVSHSLCFAYLEDSSKCIAVIPAPLVAEWTRKILGLYETGGLVAARKFMVDPRRFFIGPLKGACGLHLSEIQSTMQLYLDGLSGGGVELAVADKVQTDTRTIRVPEFLDVFTKRQENYLLYKFLISMQWKHIDCRVFENVMELVGEIENDQLLFSHYPDPARALELFAVGQVVASLSLLQNQLPGLVRTFLPLYLDLVDSLEPTGESTDYCKAVKELLRFSVDDSQGGQDEPLKKIIVGLVRDGAYSGLIDLYQYFRELPGGCNFGKFCLVLGHFNFTSVISAIKTRRAETKNKFVFLMAEAMKNNRDKEEAAASNAREETESSLIVITDKKNTWTEQPQAEYLLENGDTELPEELQRLIADIESDLGELPEAYVQAAAGVAAGGVNNRETVLTGDSWCEVVPGLLAHSYDEWDYRRGGYRKQWCTLYEKPLSPVKSTFIDDTLYKYKGQLQRIRRQFEMLRTQHRFVRRRRHGDDIDLDALIDALGDSKAGLTPSDRLFLRLLRDKREISTSFLVDMSNSTEGWVGTAMKESLVLMAEAMEIVGDPYSIYGFSGMRRSKSELFPIKELEELYSHDVKERIAAISPREYTRMGPPIRHVTQKMLHVESRVRLIIVFSDGKPEDYDDYKGTYAIEDTRKAILEARGCGVRVFCITIDKAAHEYLGHMFGRGQFVFVDNVKLLPEKLVEMYRLLTC